MSNVNEYKDILAFHPGYYVSEMIEDMGVSQGEFATRLGTTPKTVSTLVNGQISLSNDIAKKLSAMTGTDVETWLNLQKSYDEKRILIEREKELDEQKQIIDQIDYVYFEKNAGLARTREQHERINNLCKYLQISDLRTLMKTDFLVNFKTGIIEVETKNVINAQAWIQTALNFSKEIETLTYNAERLKKYLPEFHGMVAKRPGECVPRIKKIFADCGVAFVLLPHLKNSGVDSTVKWIGNSKAVLAMKDSTADNEKFWLTLFCGIKHVFQQRVKTTFVSGNISDLVSKNDELEKEAEAFALAQLHSN